MDLLESRNGNLQHNAAFALYGLADNEDNIADIVRDGDLLPTTIPSMCRSRKKTPRPSYCRHAPPQYWRNVTAVTLMDSCLSLLPNPSTGGVQRLQRADLIVQASKDCVQKTIKRLEEKITGAARTSKGACLCCRRSTEATLVPIVLLLCALQARCCTRYCTRCTRQTARCSSAWPQPWRASPPPPTSRRCEALRQPLKQRAACPGRQSWSKYVHVQRYLTCLACLNRPL
jgi:hypothetical protein